MALDLKSFAIGKANSGGYPEPIGTIEITENGTYDIKDKAVAEVNVQGGNEPIPYILASDIATATEMVALLQGLLPTGQWFVAKKNYLHYNDAGNASYNATGGIVINGDAAALRHTGHGSRIFELVTGGYACSASAGDTFYFYNIQNIV